MTGHRWAVLTAAEAGLASLAVFRSAGRRRRSPPGHAGPHPTPAPPPASRDLAPPPGPRQAPLTPRDSAMATAQRADLIVRGSYFPDTLHLEPDRATTLHVERQDGSWCSDVLTIPALGIEVDLPCFEPVIVELPALSPGRYEITCGMEMLRGTIDVGHTTPLTGTPVRARGQRDRTCEPAPRPAP